VFNLKMLLDAGGAERSVPATAAANLANSIDNPLAVVANRSEPAHAIFVMPVDKSPTAALLFPFWAHDNVAP